MNFPKEIIQLICNKFCNYKLIDLYLNVLGEDILDKNFWIKRIIDISDITINEMNHFKKHLSYSTYYFKLLKEFEFYFYNERKIIETGRLDLIKMAYKSEFNIMKHAKDSARFGQLNILKFMIEKGLNIYDDNCAILRLAAHNGHFEIVKYLYELGIDLECFQNYALKWSLVNKHYDIVYFIIDKIDMENIDETDLYWLRTYGNDDFNLFLNKKMINYLFKS